MPFNFGDSLFGSFSGLGDITTILIVCGILGLLLGIILLFVFLPARNRGKYQGAAKWFYDFLNFHKYWITSLLKILNIMLAVICLLGGFICLFIYPAFGFGLMIAYVLYRMLLELIMVVLNIRDNVSEIGERLSHMDGSAPQAPVNGAGYSAPLPGGYNVPAPGAYGAPAPKTCPSCGGEIEPGTAFCMRCGTRV